MTDQPNAKVDHALFVKQLLDVIGDTSFLEKFINSNNIWYKRSLCQRIVDGQPYYHHQTISFPGPYTVKGFREWLNVIEAIEKEIGLDAAIDNDDDGSAIYALWRIEVPYTEVEKRKAQEWLDNNPATYTQYPATIKWRRPLGPNQIHTLSGEHDDDDYCETI